MGTSSLRFLPIYLNGSSYFTNESNKTKMMQVGAPPEVAARLEEACASAAAMGSSGVGCIGEDPALDQFMEAYCEMLTKYEQELSKPFKEAMLFLQRVESQFKALTVSSQGSGDDLLFKKKKTF